MNARCLLVAATLVAAGCRDTTPAPAATGFVDPEGRPVVVEALPAERVVSTMQSATEWLVLLGATDRLVARTDFDRQPVLADLPSIGGGLDPSPEAIAALRPDVVLGWLARSSVDLAGALAPFGIPVLGLESTDTADAFGQLALLGRLVGREDRAATLADSLRGELARLRTSSCGTDARYETVLVVISTEPPLTAGPGTWMTELLGVACLRNVFDDLAQAWPQVSLEAIVDRQPRWILTSRGDRPGARQRELLEQAGWRQLAAVQEGRIIELGGDLFARAGVGMAEWVRAVVRGRTIEDQGRPTP